MTPNQSKPNSTPTTQSDSRGLKPYQRDWLRVPRYRTNAGGQVKAVTKTLTKARRIGGTYAAAIDCANLATGVMWDEQKGWVADKPCDVFVVSRSMPQARSVIAEVADWSRRVSPYDERYEADIQAETVKFTSGKTVRAIPCDKGSIRGYTGAVLWDEAVFAERPDDVWGALKAVAGANLRDPRGYQVSLVTTPWAQGTFAHRLFTDPALPFHRQTVDIFTAAEQGFPIDLEATRAECALEEIWLVEYCCQWLHGGGSFFDPTLLANAARSTIPKEVLEQPSYWGIDIGRTHDLTVAVEVKLYKDEYWVVDMLSLRNVHFDDQVDRLIQKLNSGPFVYGKIDQGLMGRPIADTLNRRFNSRIYGVNMTGPEQELLAVNSRSLLEKGKLLFYTGFAAEEMRSLTAELVSIRAKPSSGHHTKFETPKDAVGHGDRAWACLLALSAATAPNVTTSANKIHTFDAELMSVFT